ncbi:RNase H domain-containing protein [Abeliophyllum distichum]|uniref:RNase H domain-containing protein n=1 Tax=Abeliophyllum distichum TaxID=126358 RepID=A0ABD1TCU6_9LAMI
MDPILAFLKAQTLPTDKDETRKLRRRAAHFVLSEDVLYKRGYSMPLLRCMGVNEADYVLREIHEGICGNHSGGLALAQKILKKDTSGPLSGRTPSSTLENVTSANASQQFRGNHTKSSPWYLALGLSPSGELIS